MQKRIRIDKHDSIDVIERYKYEASTEPYGQMKGGIRMPSVRMDVSVNGEIVGFVQIQAGDGNYRCIQDYSNIENQSGQDRMRSLCNQFVDDSIDWFKKSYNSVYPLWLAHYIAAGFNTHSSTIRHD